MYTLISVYCSSFANMFANILGMKLLLVLFSVNAVSPQSCGIEGICHGFVGSWEISESLDNCIVWALSEECLLGLLQPQQPHLYKPRGLPIS